jgi:hypothetical protein
MALGENMPAAETLKADPASRLRSLKALCGLVCFLLLASNVWSMSHWNEARGVYDDVCYLRQAHLFQRFGLGGFNTDISGDDDQYVASKLKEIAFPTWNDPTTVPCHTLMPASGKRVIQYPPGTGLLLALFPQGHQVIPLYVAASVILFGFALLGIGAARTVPSVVVAGAMGFLAIYLMINPSKASYSMAPTMAACALAGYLTTRLLIHTPPSRRVAMASLLGLVLGVSVNFRLPNLLLASGYVLFLLVAFARSPKISAFMKGVGFGVAWLAGMAPTLISNAINAGSPLATTYGGQDVTAPGFSFDTILQYVTDMQFVLLLLAGGWVGWIFFAHREEGIRRVARLVATNLAANLAFFLSHPIVTPYYTIPIAMLSLWTLLFASLAQPMEAVDHGLAKQAAGARS